MTLSRDRILTYLAPGEAGAVNMLALLLDPDGPLGREHASEAFRDRFLRVVQGSVGPEFPLEGPWRVFQEWSVETGEGRGRAIDLVLRGSRSTVAIEAKITSPPSGEQLEDEYVGLRRQEDASGNQRPIALLLLSPSQSLEPLLGLKVRQGDAMGLLAWKAVAGLLPKPAEFGPSAAVSCATWLLEEYAESLAEIASGVDRDNWPGLAFEVRTHYRNLLAEVQRRLDERLMESGFRPAWDGAFRVGFTGAWWRFKGCAGQYLQLVPEFTLLRPCLEEIRPGRTLPPMRLEFRIETKTSRQARDRFEALAVGDLARALAVPEGHELIRGEREVTERFTFDAYACDAVGRLADRVLAFVQHFRPVLECRKEG